VGPRRPRPRRRRRSPPARSSALSGVCWTMTDHLRQIRDKREPQATTDAVKGRQRSRRPPARSVRLKMISLTEGCIGVQIPSCTRPALPTRVFRQQRRLAGGGVLGAVPQSESLGPRHPATVRMPARGRAPRSHCRFVLFRIKAPRKRGATVPARRVALWTCGPPRTRRPAAP